MAHILLVEDDEELAQRLEAWLEHEEHTLTIAGDGMTAYESLTAGQFDLLILDWDLPGGVKGIDVLKGYRESGGEAPVLMMTGRGGIGDKSEGFDAGADDYLTKPFHLKELSLRIKALLRRKPETVAEAPLRQILFKLCTICGASYGMEAELCDACAAVLETTEMDPLIGTTFGERYEIEEVLGSGGMSMVYKAEHKLMKRKVAIKVMLEEMNRVESAAQRFQLEAQAVSRLSHPNIVMVHDFGLTTGKNPRAYMVLDYLEGKDLDYLLDETGHLEYCRATEIFIQAARGLAHAHERGVLHRDIKPSNLVVIAGEDGKEHVRIVDFGIARIKPAPGEAEQKLTPRGESFGTCDYMSPEFCKGKELDGRSDMYSLGCLMFETLTGVCPFEGENYLDTLQKQIFTPAPAFNEVRPDLRIPADIERVVRKTLEKDPSKRFGSMVELVEALAILKANLCPDS